MKDDGEPIIDEYLDCCGETRRFKLRTYLSPGGEYLEAVEMREDDTAFLRFFMPVPPDGEPPYMEIRRKIRTRLSQRDVIRHPKTGVLEILNDLVRGQISDSEAGHPTPDVILNDMVVSWGELGQALMTYNGWGLRIEIHDCGDE